MNKNSHLFLDGLELCRAWLKIHLLENVNNKCIRCGSSVKYRISTSNLLIYTWASCKQAFSCFRGTVSDTYKKSLRSFIKHLIY